MNWIIVSIVVAALAAFGVWMKHLVDAIGKGQESELKRIEERIDHVRELTQANHDNAMKALDTQYSHLTSHLVLLREELHGAATRVEGISEKVDKLI